MAAQAGRVDRDQTQAVTQQVPARTAGRPTTEAGAGTASPASLRSLQRLVGNRAVTTLVSAGRMSHGSGIPLHVQRETLNLRAGTRVSDTAPQPTDNVREDVLPLLDRLHTLWSIDNDNYGIEQRKIVALPAGAQVPQNAAGPPAWSFKPTFDAMRRNREPTLAAPVIEHYLGGLRAAGSVGQGMNNAKADVLAVQGRLNFLQPYPEYAAERAAAEASAGQVPDSALSGTFTAITAFKSGIASGMLGWQSVRADESEHGVDRFAGQTTSHTVTVRVNHSATGRPAGETDEAITVSIFLPSGLTQQNKVALFFSPGSGTEDTPAQPGANATNVHAMRSGADPSPWILIGIPGFRHPTKETGWNSFNTAAILSCLARAGRAPRIDGIRLVAHSRGGRGLSKTVERRSVDIGLVDKVIMLDQPHRGLQQNLAAATPRGRRPPPVIDYTQGQGIRGSGTTLRAETIRAIGFARLIQDRSDVPPPAAAASTIRPIIADLPPRGRFTTATPPAAGKTNVHLWSVPHAGDIAAIARVDEAAEREWTRFSTNPRTPLAPTVNASPYFHVNTRNLMRYFPGPIIDATGAPTDFGFGLGIYAHHLFAAEFSEEFFR